MKKIILTTLSLFILSSCHNLKSTIGQYNLPIVVNKNPTKKGETCAHYIYPFSFFLSNNDLTAEKARENGDIKEIISVESELSYVYPFYAHRCVVVRGN
ncbi:hypothetical protein LBMAG18_02130 [Alphaproteobacteria bacterium]|nr:hypothetical protein LBMAG18_02130 [Alphaproteobacteria bacterium]